MYFPRVLATILCLSTVTVAVGQDGPAIEILEREGAIVQRVDSLPDGPVSVVTYNLRQVTDEGNRALKELFELPAIEFLGTGDTELQPATLRALQGKRSLKRLSISFAKISDDSAKLLGTLRSLEVLELRAQVEIHPKVLGEVFNLTSLKELTLSDRLADDPAMEELRRMPYLKTLTVRSVFVSDAGLASLRQVKSLRNLRILLGPKVTEEGVRHLSELDLADLDITYLNVTDKELKSLRKFKGLKGLRLVSAAKVTDEAVPFLSELSELKRLDIADAKLSKAGIGQLERALPNCKIAYDSIPRN
ncbi:leucine-rich repeat domain-containing protein [Schlesneria paludicola]|uniref:hypothetical protein n=1 Tax=Schlesneria paludicola TaxID=360056 RepID=UPI00029A2BE4|nr:hypothetical protein [Schlesneria paludicola]